MNENKTKIAVIGDRDSVLGFMAIGFDVYEVRGAREAGATLSELAAGDYAVIYVCQSYAADSAVAEKIAAYVSEPLPAIIPIPDRSGGGLGEANLRRAVERAVGADIVFRD